MKKFLASTSKCLLSLPFDIQSQFPAILSKRSGLDKTIISKMHSLCDGGFGPTGVFKLLRESYTLSHNVSELAYYSLLSRILGLQEKRKQFGVLIRV
jgi:hypothetical protein